MKNSQDERPARQSKVFSTSKHDANLKRNPSLHFQIGLILALLVSLFFIELRSTEPVATTHEPIERDLNEFFWNQQFQLEKKVTPSTLQKKVTVQKQPSIENLEVVPDDSKLVVTLFEPSPSKEIPVAINTITEVVDEEPVLPTPFILIEEAPIFPGCDPNEDKGSLKRCFSEQVRRLVQKEFDTSIGESAGLHGKNTIYVQFTIDEKGAIVNVGARGPHKLLEAEAKRVMGLMPRITPGKQRGVPVKVIFSLPITYHLE